MTLLKMTALVIALSLGLSACSGMKERRANTRAKIAAADRSECLAMGFKSGTDTFLLCLDNRNILRQSKQAARAAARAAADAAHKARMKAIWDD
jgi:hypothetical protein